ncbi:MAG TPA: DUF4352 domain-containing protein [Blastocatellia bacterium]|nr:DUF4352 domain-containing protein [Blastocatellia bacterium]
MERKSRGIAVTAAIVALIGVSLLLTVAVLNRRDEIVGLNQEIQYDDFAFSVLGVRKADALGSGNAQTAALGVYYVVTLRIANHAKRVDYKFKTGSAILVDDKRREFFLSARGQAALDSAESRQCNSPIPAGVSCVTEVVFDVPRETRASQLRISEGGLVGDILDVVFYGKKRIDLGSLQ